MADEAAPVCDHCSQPVHRGSGGWWEGDDRTSDCPVSDGGHAVDGETR